VGLYCEEIEEVIPEMVRDHVHPAQYDPVTKEKISEEVDIKVIQYDKLFPLLVKSAQEQQEEIQLLKSQLAEQKELIDALLNKNK